MKVLIAPGRPVRNNVSDMCAIVLLKIDLDNSQR